MQNTVQFRVELASLMELEKFVKATYTLEGDGHLVVSRSMKVKRIRDVPFLNTNDVIQSLKDELPLTLSKLLRLMVPLISFSDYIPWWKDVLPDPPSCSSAIEKVVLVQPSSVAAERVFSLLVTMFGDQKHDALEDYLEAALMLVSER